MNKLFEAIDKLNAFTEDDEEFWAEQIKKDQEKVDATYKEITNVYPKVKSYMESNFNVTAIEKNHNGDILIAISDEISPAELARKAISDLGAKNNDIAAIGGSWTSYTLNIGKVEIHVGRFDSMMDKQERFGIAVCQPRSHYATTKLRDIEI